MTGRFVAKTGGDEKGNFGVHQPALGRLVDSQPWVRRIKQEHRGLTTEQLRRILPSLF